MASDSTISPIPRQGTLQDDPSLTIDLNDQPATDNTKRPWIEKNLDEKDDKYGPTQTQLPGRREKIVDDPV